MSRKKFADRLGCAHVSGDYYLTDKDFLNEGADEILATGMRVIKVYLHEPNKHYPSNSRWPDQFESIVQMAQHPYYVSLFGKPFTTFILTTFCIDNINPIKWNDGFSDDEYDRVSRQLYELTRYLLETYQGTGKTFVLQNWEGDWAARQSFSRDRKDEPRQPVLEAMIRWLNARQDGVNRAREEARASNVKVYHACEVNLIALAMDGHRTVTNDVVPHTRCDLYSYSAYDTIGVASQDPTEGRALFLRALDYFATKAPDSPSFGEKNVYVGEFGWPEVASSQDPQASTEKSLHVLRMTVETAREWGCPYIVYWQVYDNECRRRPPKNEDCRGWWLIKPDGMRAAAWEYFASLLDGRLP